MRRLRQVEALPATIVLVGAILRFLQLSAESYTNDEMYSVHFVRTYSPVEFLAKYPTIDPHPPLYYVFLDVWSTLFGTSELATRFPSALFGVGTIAIVYVLGRRMFDDRVGAVAALFVTLSTLHVYHSQETRMYSVLTFLTALSMYYFVRSVESPERRLQAGYAASTIFLLYTHVFGAFVLLAQVLFLVVHERRAIADRDRALVRRWGLPFLAVALAYLPVVVLVIQQVLLVQESGIFISWITRPSVFAVALAFLTYVGYQSETAILVVRALPFFVLLAVPVLWLALDLVVRHRGLPERDGDHLVTRVVQAGQLSDDVLARPRRKWALLLALWIAVVHAVPWLLSYLVTPIYVGRYTISASIGAYLLAGLGARMIADGVDWPAPITGRHANVAIAAVLVLALAVPLGSYYGDHQRDQWRDAVEYVDGQADADDAVLVVSDSPDLADLGIVYRYYADREESRVVPLGSKDDVYYDRASSLSREHDRIWLVIGLSHSVTDAERGRFDAVLTSECDPVDERRYTGVHVSSYDCAGNRSSS